MLSSRKAVFNFCRLASSLCIIGVLLSSAVEVCSFPAVPLPLLAGVHLGGGRHGFAGFTV